MDIKTLKAEFKKHFVDENNVVCLFNFEDFKNVCNCLGQKDQEEKIDIESARKIFIEQGCLSWEVEDMLQDAYKKDKIKEKIGQAQAIRLSINEHPSQNIFTILFLNEENIVLDSVWYTSKIGKLEEDNMANIIKMLFKQKISDFAIKIVNLELFNDYIAQKSS